MLLKLINPAPGLQQVPGETGVVFKLTIIQPGRTRVISWWKKLPEGQGWRDIQTVFDFVMNFAERVATSLPAKVMEWSAIDKVAGQAFSIWVDQPELAWAQMAWEKMIAAGFSTYHSEVERHQVLIRFLALCGLYHDFCHYA